MEENRDFSIGASRLFNRRSLSHRRLGGNTAAGDEKNLRPQKAFCPYGNKHWNHEILFRPFSSLTTAS